MSIATLFIHKNVISLELTILHFNEDQNRFESIIIVASATEFCIGLGRMPIENSLNLWLKPVDF